MKKFLITKDFFEGKEMPVIQAELDKMMIEFKAFITTASEKELGEYEKEIIEAQDKYSETLNSIVYKLPDNVKFEGNEIDRVVVAQYISEFINRSEVDWSYTLGLYQLYNMWTNDIKEIGYKPFDSTLRILNQLKFKGKTDWEKILIINEYLSGLHNAYTKDTYLFVYFSELHNMILSELQPETTE